MFLPSPRIGGEFAVSSKRRTLKWWSWVAEPGKWCWIYLNTIYILYIITVILYDDIWCINISYVYFNKLYIKIIDNRIIHKPSPTQTRSTLNLQIYQELWISPRPDKLWCINDVRFLYFHRDYTSISWTLLLVTMISHISIRTFQAWPMSKSSLCQPHDSRTLGTSLEIVKSP